MNITPKIYMAGHAFVKQNEKFLLLKRASTTRFMPSKWDVPGGTVEADETIEKAIAREYMEETALVISVGQPIFIHTNLLQMPERKTFQAIYTCDYVSGEVKLNPREHQEYRWVEAKDLKEYDLISFLIDFVENSDYMRLLGY